MPLVEGDAGAGPAGARATERRAMPTMESDAGAGTASASLVKVTYPSRRSCLWVMTVALPTQAAGALAMLQVILTTTLSAELKKVLAAAVNAMPTEAAMPSAAAGGAGALVRKMALLALGMTVRC